MEDTWSRAHRSFLLSTAVLVVWSSSPAAQQRAGSGLQLTTDNSTIPGCSLIAGAGRASARGLEGQGRCLCLGTVPRPLGPGTLPRRMCFGSGLEALFNMHLGTGRERGEEWEEDFYKRLHQRSELWLLKCHCHLMWVA